MRKRRLPTSIGGSALLDRIVWLDRAKVQLESQNSVPLLYFQGSNEMTTVLFPCPHCGQRLAPRPNLIGAKVQCIHCGGLYREPADPLPGVAPEKGEVLNEAEPPPALPVARSMPRQNLLQPAKSKSGSPLPMVLPLTEAANTTTDLPTASARISSSDQVDASRRTTSASTTAKTATLAPPQSIPVGINLRSSKVLAPFERAGLKAAVISWTPGKRSDTKIGCTKNCSKDEAQEMILRVAAKLIKKRWPDIYPSIAARIDRLSE